MFHHPLQRLTQEKKRFLRVRNDHSIKETLSMQAKHVLNSSTPASYARVLELRIHKVNAKQDWPLDFFRRNSSNDVGCRLW